MKTRRRIEESSRLSASRWIFLDNLAGKRSQEKILFNFPPRSLSPRVLWLAPKAIHFFHFNISAYYFRRELIVTFHRLTISRDSSFLIFLHSASLLNCHHWSFALTGFLRVLCVGKLFFFRIFQDSFLKEIFLKDVRHNFLKNFVLEFFFSRILLLEDVQIPFTKRLISFNVFTASWILPRKKNSFPRILLLVKNFSQFLDLAKNIFSQFILSQFRFSRRNFKSSYHRKVQKLFVTVEREIFLLWFTRWSGEKCEINPTRGGP